VNLTSLEIPEKASNHGCKKRYQVDAVLTFTLKSMKLQYVAGVIAETSTTASSEAIEQFAQS
jgi:hypothetical protein